MAAVGLSLACRYSVCGFTDLPPGRALRQCRARPSTGPQIVEGVLAAQSGQRCSVGRQAVLKADTPLVYLCTMCRLSHPPGVMLPGKSTPLLARSRQRSAAGAAGRHWTDVVWQAGLWRECMRVEPTEDASNVPHTHLARPPDSPLPYQNRHTGVLPLPLVFGCVGLISLLPNPIPY